LQQDGRAVLLLGRLDPHIKTIATGKVSKVSSIGFGFEFLYEPDAFLPLMASDEFRRTYRGRQVLEFIIEKGASFPRADVSGLRVSNAVREEVFLKQIDLHQGPIPFVVSRKSGSIVFTRVNLIVCVKSLTLDKDGPEVSNTGSASPMLRHCRAYKVIDSSRLAELHEIVSP
jgi:hypothetical protein